MKNLGNIIDKKDLTTKEYVDNAVNKIELMPGPQGASVINAKSNYKYTAKDWNTYGDPNYTGTWTISNANEFEKGDIALITGPVTDRVGTYAIIFGTVISVGNGNITVRSNGVTMGGATGPKGDPGVYVGSDPVPEGTKVQVDPSGEEVITIPDVLQETGNSTKNVMSQNAVTELLKDKLDINKVGKASGVAPLGEDGKVPLINLPETPPAFTPILQIEVDTGAEVTATDGKKVITGMSVDNICELNIPNFGKWTVKATLNKENSNIENIVVNEIKVYNLKLAFANIYGVEWNGTATTKWTRIDEAEKFVDPTPAINNGTGSSPFDNLMPWSGMKRVSDPQAGELVSIPKFYYKWTKSGNGLKLQIADKKVEGFLVSPAHMDRGDGKGERDIVYVGRYHCSGRWKSDQLTHPKNNVTRSQARSSIHSLGPTIWQWDWHMHMTIWMLYLVEFADWNCQTVIGYGCGNNSGVEDVGRTDGMKYHTGTSWPNRTTYGVGVQYRYIEGLWDNVRDWVDGCYYNSAGLNIINNPAKFSDTANGTPVGVPTSGYPSKFEIKTVNGFQVIYPVQSNGSQTTYTCDYWHFSASNPCLYVGGNYSQYLDYGIGYVNNNGVSYSVADIGPRLQKLP